MGDVLLVVFEVPEENKVACQAPGSNRPVHRQFHVVLHNNSIQVYGSACCRRLFGEAVAASTPRYSTSQGRVITQAERELLQSNTAQLVAELELEFDQRHQALAARAATDQQRHQLDADRLARARTEWRSGPRPTPARAARHVPLDLAAVPPEVLAAAIGNLRERMQISDPTAPGWRGLLVNEIERITRARVQPGKSDQP